MPFIGEAHRFRRQHGSVPAGPCARSDARDHAVPATLLHPRHVRRRRRQGQLQTPEPTRRHDHRTERDLPIESHRARTIEAPDVGRPAGVAAGRAAVAGTHRDGEGAGESSRSARPHCAMRSKCTPRRSGSDPAARSRSRARPEARTLQTGASARGAMIASLHLGDQARVAGLVDAVLGRRIDVTARQSSLRGRSMRVRRAQSSGIFDGVQRELRSGWSGWITPISSWSGTLRHADRVYAGAGPAVAGHVRQRVTQTLRTAGRSSIFTFRRRTSSARDVLSRGFRLGVRAVCRLAEYPIWCSRTRTTWPVYRPRSRSATTS